MTHETDQNIIDRLDELLEVERTALLEGDLEKIAALGFPVLMGPSRKSFIQNILSRNEKTTIGADNIKTEYGTLAAISASILNGAHIVRVHDVEKVKSFTHIIDSIRNA